MKKKLSQKKQKYISKYTNEAYITYQFRLRKNKDVFFIKEIAPLIGDNKKSSLKKLILETIIKKHILFEPDYIFDNFIKFLFKEYNVNKILKLSSFYQIVDLYNYGLIDFDCLNLVLEQFDAIIIREKYCNQYNKFFYDDECIVKNINYQNYVKLNDAEFKKIISGREQIYNRSIRHIYPNNDVYKVK